jgi:uncharacterized repeat protein (TIGR04138 family)
LCTAEWAHILAMGGRGRAQDVLVGCQWVTRRLLHDTNPLVRGSALPELAFRDGIMDQIRLREPRFHEHAYLFILSALEFSQSRLPERRHITGRELAEACRDLALDRYGVMARLVLEHWGVRSTADLGDVVFTLVDLGLLISQPTDSRLDFADVFGFDQAFGRDYPWRRAGQA